MEVEDRQDLPHVRLKESNVAEVRLENVWKTYGKVDAVKNLSIDCQDGEFFVILGPTGAGKTTTLKMISGIEKVSRGSIYIDNKIVNNLSPQERDVAMVFETYALYPHLSVFENIASPLKAPIRRGEFSSKKIWDRIHEVARMLEIEDLLNRMPAQLSGGQRQRVGLGRALVREPAVFLMDEPIAHLDAKLRDSLRPELRRWQKDRDFTVIYTTHDHIEALSMADRIAILKSGELQQLGFPAEIYSHPVNEFVALNVGFPPMNILEGCLIVKEHKTWIKTEAFRVPMDNEVAKKMARDKESVEVKVGVRAHDVDLSTTKLQPYSSKAEVYVVEPMGLERVVMFKFGEQFFSVLTRGMRLKPGDVVWLEIKPEKLHFFDKRTGSRIM